jgi:hypothetical protein
MQPFRRVHALPNQEALQHPGQSQNISGIAVSAKDQVGQLLLRVDKAPDPLAFLRTTLTPNQVVVGQQVTFAVEKNTVWIRDAAGVEHKLRVSKKTAKPAAR